MFLYLPLRYVLELIIKVKFSVNRYGAYYDKNLKMEKKKISQNFTFGVTAVLMPVWIRIWIGIQNSDPDRHQNDAYPQYLLLVLMKY
jgi:hypothetical protein